MNFFRAPICSEKKQTSRKELCKTILSIHIVELFPFLVPTRKNYKIVRSFSYSQFAPNKKQQNFQPNIFNQPSSCSLLNGFSASNQTLHSDNKKDRIHQSKRVPVVEEIVCVVHAKEKESKSSLPYLQPKFSLSLTKKKSRSLNTLSKLYFFIEKTCNMLFYICSFVVCVLLFIS